MPLSTIAVQKVQLSLMPTTPTQYRLQINTLVCIQHSGSITKQQVAEYIRHGILHQLPTCGMLACSDDEHWSAVFVQLVMDIGLASGVLSFHLI